MIIERFLSPKKLNMAQQVQKNKEDIAVLEAIIKEAYNTQQELTEDATAIAIGQTNVPTGVSDGWLLDKNGKLFSIIETTAELVYIDFWANLQGPAGPQGERGEVGPQGERGEVGPQGATGEKGINCYVSEVIYTLDRTPGSGLPLNSIKYSTIGSIPRVGDNVIFILQTSSPAQQFIALATITTLHDIALEFDCVLQRVTYNINGATGPQGPQGVGGAEDIKGITLVNADPTLVTYSTEDGIVVESQGLLRDANNVNHYVDVINKVPIIGSDNITLDIDETGKKAKVDLDATILAKIDNAISKPATAPSTPVLIGVNTLNEQEAIVLGTGLSLEGNVLNAEGGSGGGGITATTATTLAELYNLVRNANSILYIDVITAETINDVMLTSDQTLITSTDNVISINTSKQAGPSMFAQNTITRYNFTQDLGGIYAFSQVSGLGVLLANTIAVADGAIIFQSLNLEVDGTTWRYKFGVDETFTELPTGVSVKVVYI